MQVVGVCLGLLSCIYLSECTIIGWTVPHLASANGTAGTVFLNEGSTIIQTVAAKFSPDTDASMYKIVSQTTEQFFEISTPGGEITVKNGQLDATDTKRHVLTIQAVDNLPEKQSTATVTITYSIIRGQFSSRYSCMYLRPGLPVGGAVTTNAMSSEGTNEITIKEGNINTDFTIAKDTGVMTAAKVLTSASETSGRYTIILNGVENIGTSSTATSTIEICMHGSSCECPCFATCSATTITTGLRVMFAAAGAAAIMLLLQ